MTVQTPFSFLPQTELPTELPFPIRLSLVLGAGPCTTAAAVTANASLRWLASFPPSSFPPDLLQFLLFGRHAVLTALQRHGWMVAGFRSLVSSQYPNAHGGALWPLVNKTHPFSTTACTVRTVVSDIFSVHAMPCKPPMQRERLSPPSLPPSLLYISISSSISCMQRALINGCVRSVGEWREGTENLSSKLCLSLMHCPSMTCNSRHCF